MKQKNIYLNSIFVILLLCAACGKEKKANDYIENSWKKTAFLLEDEDIFFANLPQHWRTEQGGKTFARIFCPDENVLSDGYEEFYRVDIRKYDASQKTFRNEDYGASESFTFCDGTQGERYTLELDRMNQYPNLKKEGAHSDVIFSPDKKYFLQTDRLTNGQYEEYAACAQKMYDTMYFGSGCIGQVQSGPLQERDAVELHADMRFGFRTVVPEGISFKINEPPEGHDTAGSYELYLYLDDRKENYVKITDDMENLAPMTYLTYSECYGKRLVESDFEEMATYITSRQDGQIFYVYSFFWGDLVQIRVPEEDEEMLAAALDIVKNMRWRK